MQSNDYTTDEERRRQLAFERGRLNQANSEPTLIDPNQLSEAERQRYDGWMDIYNEYNNVNGQAAVGSTVEQSAADEVQQLDAVPSDMTRETVAENESEVVAQPEQVVEQLSEQPMVQSIVEQTVAPEQPKERSIEEIRESAIAKKGAERQSPFIQSATARQLEVYGDASDGDNPLQLTDEEQRAYDDMHQQMMMGNNATSATAINAITGADVMNGHTTDFDKTIQANGIAALMQDAKLPPSESRQGLDASEMVMASQVGFTPETTLASQVESVQPLDRLGGDNPNEIRATGVDIDQAASTLQLVSDRQNNGMNLDGTVSDLSEERLREAQNDVSSIQAHQEQMDKAA